MRSRTVATNDLIGFLEESSLIEGITLTHDDLGAQATALKTLLEVREINTFRLAEFRAVVQPDAMLRNKPGMNVSVGGHLPPVGGGHVVEALQDILGDANLGEHPYGIHHRFETLHPYTDGNGRTGRALWLWQMVNQHGYDCRRRFLHEWYYQSLAQWGVSP